MGITTSRKTWICLRRQQLIDRESCHLSNALQEFHGWRMDPSQDVADGGLANAHAARKLCLGRIRRFEIGVESLHIRCKSIGNAYRSAIGQSYEQPMHALYMAKPRSFLDRATEALKEKYPDQSTQGKLASLAGVTQPSVNEWKSGYPAMKTAVRLAERLGVCVEWLFTERGPKYPPAVPENEASLSTIWPQLDEQKKAEVTRFADFIKDNKNI